MKRGFLFLGILIIVSLFLVACGDDVSKEQLARARAQEVTSEKTANDSAKLKNEIKSEAATEGVVVVDDSKSATVTPTTETPTTTEPVKPVKKQDSGFPWASVITLAIIFGVIGLLIWRIVVVVQSKKNDTDTGGGTDAQHKKPEESEPEEDKDPPENVTVLPGTRPAIAIFIAATLAMLGLSSWLTPVVMASNTSQIIDSILATNANQDKGINNNRVAIATLKARLNEHIRKTGAVPTEAQIKEWVSEAMKGMRDETARANAKNALAKANSALNSLKLSKNYDSLRTDIATGDKALVLALGGDEAEATAYAGEKEPGKKAALLVVTIDRYITKKSNTTVESTTQKAVTPAEDSEAIKIAQEAKDLASAANETAKGAATNAEQTKTELSDLRENSGAFVPVEESDSCNSQTTKKVWKFNSALVDTKINQALIETGGMVEVEVADPTDQTGKTKIKVWKRVPLVSVDQFVNVATDINNGLERVTQGAARANNSGGWHKDKKEVKAGNERLNQAFDAIARAREKIEALKMPPETKK
ncbi:MAG: hypothetical protein NTV62_01365 [Candidatus Gribaldobacteria bacterium]|nr:hypothetical protein [Candidatus Gribaldobacteria bacterium]